MSEEFVVVAATRTPIGSLPGRLVGVPASCLAAASITGALKRRGPGCAWAAIGIGGEVTAVAVETPT